MSVNQELKESYLQPQVLLSKEMKQDVQYCTPYLTYTVKVSTFLKNLSKKKHSSDV